MENFIFSLSSTMPIFAVIALGIIVRRLGFLNDEYITKANRLNFYTAMPALLFMNMYGQQLRGVISFYTLAVVMLCLAAAFLITFVIAHFFVKDKYMRGAFAQGAYRGNAALIGVALVTNVCGESAVAAGITACVIPMYNIGSVIYLNVFPAKGGNNKKSIGSVIKGIVTNPLIIGTLLGAAFSVAEIKLPSVAERTIGYVADMAMGTSLICIGASMKFESLRRCFKPALASSMFKLVVFPLLFMPVAYMAGFRSDALMAAFVAFGSPAAINSYTMAQSMNHDADLASGIIVISALLGSVTMTLWVFVMRSMGLV